MKNVPFGTVVPVEVLEVKDTMGYQVSVFRQVDDPTSAYMLLNERGAVVAEPGQVGLLVFTEGGPTGGFWKWQADPTRPELPEVPTP